MSLPEVLSAGARPSASLARWAPFFLRLIVGYGFMEHGCAKIARGPEHFAGILVAIGVPEPHLMSWLTIPVEGVWSAAVATAAALLFDLGARSSRAAPLPGWSTESRDTASRQAEILQRSASDPASDIRLDDQFEYINVVKIHLILFHFACRSGWTEIPLLANDLFKCGPVIRRPSQNELLCTANFVFLKNKGYAFEPLRVIED